MVTTKRPGEHAVGTNAIVVTTERPGELAVGTSAAIGSGLARQDGYRDFGDDLIRDCVGAELRGAVFQ